MVKGMKQDFKINRGEKSWGKEEGREGCSWQMESLDPKEKGKEGKLFVILHRSTYYLSYT